MVVELTFGAVNRPVLVMVPAAADQFTAVLVLPVTVAVNCWDAPATSPTPAGERDIEIGVGGGEGGAGGGGVTGAFTDTVVPARVLL
jgi:hypothetical protein